MVSLEATVVPMALVTIAEQKLAGARAP